MSASVITPDMIAGIDSTAIEPAGGRAEPIRAEAEAPPSPEFQVEFPSGEGRTYMQAIDFRKDIIDGQIPEGSRARIVPNPGASSAAEPAWISVRELAVHHAELRSAYRPVWDTALRFMGYGAMAGIALKLLETTATMFMIDDTLGVVWLVVIGSIALSSRWAMAPLAAIYFSFKVGIGANLFITALTAGLVGAAFGAPLGLVIGTLVGHFRKSAARTAPDARPEGARPYMLGLAVPVIFLSLAIPAYVWVNIKAFEWLAS